MALRNSDFQFQFQSMCRGGYRGRGGFGPPQGRGGGGGGAPQGGQMMGGGGGPPGGNNPNRNNDCEIVCVRRQLRGYAEHIEQK